MGSEKTTLRAFGGGIDPAAVDLDDEDEVRARKQFVVTGGDRTITDLGVRLERDLVERLDPRLLNIGEERRRLRMQPQQADWTAAMYIYAEPTEENRKFDRVIMQYDGYPTVGVPRAWLRNEAVNGIDNPFHTAGPDDHVVVRYLPGGAIEIYPEEVFNTHPEFTRLRATAPLAVVSPNESEDIPCFNLAASTPYDGHMFEIVPFDWNVFQDYIDRDRSTLSGNQLTVDEFNRVLTERGVKPCSTSLLQIHWDTRSLFLKDVLSSSREETRCLELENTGRFRVILPAKGMVQICSFTEASVESQMVVSQGLARRLKLWPAKDGGFNHIGLGTGTVHYRRYIAQIDDHWYGRFFKIPEHGPPIIYLPTDPE